VDLVRLTLDALAAGSRWAVITAACGVTTYKDLAGVIYRITGDTGTCQASRSIPRPAEVHSD
jgi:hypothetical protein